MTEGQDTLNKGKIHVPGGMEWAGVPFRTSELGRMTVPMPGAVLSGE